MNKENTEVKRIESKDEIVTYLDRLKYALQSGQAFHYAEEDFEVSDFPYAGKAR